MILRLLKGRGMVSGPFAKKRDAIPPHPAPPQALCTLVIYLKSMCNYNRNIINTPIDYEVHIE
jgi:hypothetical protein